MRTLPALLLLCACGSAPVDELGVDCAGTLLGLGPPSTIEACDLSAGQERFVLELPSENAAVSAAMRNDAPAAVSLGGCAAGPGRAHVTWSTIEIGQPVVFEIEGPVTCDGVNWLFLELQVTATIDRLL